MSIVLEIIRRGIKFLSNNVLYVAGLWVGSQLFISGCKESFAPPATKVNVNFLVVDGFLHLGLDSTIIKLSRTRSLADTVPGLAELPEGIRSAE